MSGEAGLLFKVISDRHGSKDVFLCSMQSTNSLKRIQAVELGTKRGKKFQILPIFFLPTTFIRAYFNMENMSRIKPTVGRQTACTDSVSLS